MRSQPYSKEAVQVSTSSIRRGAPSNGAGRGETVLGYLLFGAIICLVLALVVLLLDLSLTNVVDSLKDELELLF